MFRRIFVFAVLLFASSASQGDYAFGIEYAETERSLSPFGLGFSSRGANAYTAFVGFDLTNSMLYVRHSEEEAQMESDFTFLGQPLAFEFSRSDTSLEWHWNETTKKHNFFGTVFGLFRTNYTDIGTPESSFFGILGGVKGTRFLLGEQLFVQGVVKLRAALVDSQERENAAQYALGVEGEVAIGFIVGREKNFAVRLGYRKRNMDYRNSFPSDKRSDIFMGIRVFVGASP